MRRRNIKNENLDRAGRELLAAAREGEREKIEKIVNSPALFQSVKTRIETERRTRDAKKMRLSFSANGIFSGRQKFAAVSAALLFFVFAAFGAFVFSNLDTQTIAEISAPEISAPVESFQIPPAEKKSFEDSRENAQASRQKSKRQPIAVKENLNSRKGFQNQARTRKSELKQTPPPVEFYALGSSENAVQPGEELKIVRAELSRAELFALGVNLPIENAPAKIKTDMLVGRDGVARAFRIVE